MSISKWLFEELIIQLHIILFGLQEEVFLLILYFDSVEVPCDDKKGSIFWYKSKGKKYAAIVLDIIKDYYFILISEELNGAKTVDEIMEIPAYTAAWFNSFELLSIFRMHIISELCSEECFNGYAGGYISDLAVSIYNCGQSKTWKHEFRQLSFHGMRMKELLHLSAYNLTRRIYE